MVINPIVGVYIPIIRIPIKGGMTIPNIANFWPWHIFHAPLFPKSIAPLSRYGKVIDVTSSACAFHPSMMKSHHWTMVITSWTSNHWKPFRWGVQPTSLGFVESKTSPKWLAGKRDVIFCKVKHLTKLLYVIFTNIAYIHLYIYIFTINTTPDMIFIPQIFNIPPSEYAHCTFIIYIYTYIYIPVIFFCFGGTTNQGTIGCTPSSVPMVFIVFCRDYWGWNNP